MTALHTGRTTWARAEIRHQGITTTARAEGPSLAIAEPTGSGAPDRRLP